MIPQFTDEEAYEMADLNSNFGYQCATFDILHLLKEKYGWSDVHEVITTIRKEIIQKKFIENQAKFDKDNKSGTLMDKLMKRLNYKDKLKEQL